MYTLPYTKAVDLESRSRKLAEGIFVTDRLTWSVVVNEDTTAMEPGTTVTFQVRDDGSNDVQVERIR